MRVAAGCCAVPGRFGCARPHVTVNRIAGKSKPEVATIEIDKVSFEHAISAARGAERSLQLALAAARTAAENRGQNIVILDLRELTPVFDYFVLATGTSGRQLRSMSEDIDNVLEKQLGDKRMGIEGFQDSRWILLDYGTVVVHLFDADTRAYYDLENLWSGAKRLAPAGQFHGRDGGEPAGTEV
jgi:ribosome-associated protein